MGTGHADTHTHTFGLNVNIENMRQNARIETCRSCKVKEKETNSFPP